MKVSAIMPTANRAEYIWNAVACFLAQEWEDKELIVLDSGSYAVDFLFLPDDPRIRYVRVDTPGLTIGALRNLAIAETTGEIIVHFDDDDWSAPDRISSQVADLGNADVTAFRDLLYWHVGLRVPAVWEPPQGSWRSAAGYSLMYRKSWWENHRFKEDRTTGEDGDFISGAAGAKAIHIVESRNRIVSSLRDALYERRVVSRSILPAGFFGLNFERGL